jgi:hypothetical protein
MTYEKPKRGPGRGTRRLRRATATSEATTGPTSSTCWRMHPEAPERWARLLGEIKAAEQRGDNERRVLRNARCGQVTPRSLVVARERSRRRYPRPQYVMSGHTALSVG